MQKQYCEQAVSARFKYGQLHKIITLPQEATGRTACGGIEQLMHD